jgi:hypothetical protein
MEEDPVPYCVRVSSPYRWVEQQVDPARTQVPSRSRVSTGHLGLVTAVTGEPRPRGRGPGLGSGDDRFAPRGEAPVLALAHR